MNKRVLGRLAIVLGLLGVLVLATAAPATPAAPAAADMQLAPQPAWAGHASCGALVDVSLGGDSIDVGGYETRVNFDPSYFGYSANSITLTNWLTDDGTRNTSAYTQTVPPFESVPALVATGADYVKFGDYSWGTQGGADGEGDLARVELDIVQCGTSSVSLDESQVVDYLGNPFAPGTEASVSVPVYDLVDVVPNGIVDTDDINRLLPEFGNFLLDTSCGSSEYMLDVVPNGIVDTDDINLLVSQFGRFLPCP